MVMSMTGFALKTITLTNNRMTAHLTLSIKSLNSRFLEATCKMPGSLQYLETDLVKRFKETLLRGYVVFAVHISNQSFFKGPATAEINTAQSYLNAIATLQKECNLQGTVSIRDILTLPSIFSIEEQVMSQTEKDTIFRAVDELLQDLVKARSLEGSALYDDLIKRCEIIHAEITIVMHEAKRTMEERKIKLLEKLASLNTQTPQDGHDTQRNSLYFDLDKIDIHEEIIRFNNHLKTFCAYLESDDQEKGRRLDFTLQELAREINTITAKCSDSVISSHAINIKVELEKAREQIQNIV